MYKINRIKCGITVNNNFGPNLDYVKIAKMANNDVIMTA